MICVCVCVYTLGIMLKVTMFPLGWSCISAGVSGQNVFLYWSVPDFNVKPAAERPLKP